MVMVVALDLPWAAVAAEEEAPPSLPVPAPPPVKPPAGFTSAETNHARIYVEPGGDSDAEAFARSWGLLIDDAIDQLETFLPPLSGQSDLYVYASDASYAAATSQAPWPEPEPTDVLPIPDEATSRSTWGHLSARRHSRQKTSCGTPCPTWSRARHHGAVCRVASTRDWPAISSGQSPPASPATPRWYKTLARRAI